MLNWEKTLLGGAKNKKDVGCAQHYSHAATPKDGTGEDLGMEEALSRGRMKLLFSFK